MNVDDGRIMRSWRSCLFHIFSPEIFMVAGKKCDNVLVPQYLNGSTTDSNQIYT